MCDFFILTKENGNKIDDDNKNKLISFKDNKVYILPKNNLNYYLNNGLFEKHIIEWSSQFCKKDKNFLDIGAHTGTYSISLAHLNNNVFSFEPQKMTFYSLCGSVALSNIKNISCYNFGLGDEEQVGMQQLNIVSLDGGGSSLHNSSLNILNTETIEVRTLDSFNFKNIGFIKIDIEENELQVLYGSIQTLKNSNYPEILFEMNTINQDIVSFLNNIGYKINQLIGYNNMFIASHEK